MIFISTSPSLTSHLQVLQTPPLHANGKSAPAFNAASSKTHRRSELLHGLATLDEEVRIRPQKTSTIIQEGNEDEEDDDNSDEYSYHSSEEELTQATATWTLASRKAETKEQKKARKTAAKEQQSLRRKNKKTLKTVFKEEKGKAIRIEGKRDSVENISVFRY